LYASHYSTDILQVIYFHIIYLLNPFFLETLTLEQVLSRVPPPASFCKPKSPGLSESSESSKKRKSSKSATKSGNHVPKDVLSWDGFLEKVNEFVDPKRHPNPQFTIYNNVLVK